MRRGKLGNGFTELWLNSDSTFKNSRTKSKGLRQKKVGHCALVRAHLNLSSQSWNELVNRLLNRETPNEAPAENTNLLKQLTNVFEVTNAFIEAARDRLGLNTKEFAVLLGEELYRDIVFQFGTKWARATRAFCLLLHLATYKSISGLNSWILFGATTKNRPL